MHLDKYVNEFEERLGVVSGINREHMRKIRRSGWANVGRRKCRMDNLWAR